MLQFPQCLLWAVEFVGGNGNQIPTGDFKILFTDEVIILLLNEFFYRFRICRRNEVILATRQE